MSADAIATRARIKARFDELGLALDAIKIQQLTEYFCLLAKWNTKMNLTALPVAGASDSAIDRLLVEPIVASKLVRDGDELALDLGSGGGSPAFPLKVGAPHLRMVLVESKQRKCAFLREVVRALALSGIEVANTRFEALPSRSDVAGQADLVSFRAVRTDDSLWATTAGLLKPGGRAFWFGGPEGAKPDLVSPESGAKPSSSRLELVSSHVLVPASASGEGSRLAILQRN